MKDWWRLLKRAYFVVRLWLTRKRRALHIAELELALGMGVTDGSHDVIPYLALSLYELQGSSQDFLIGDPKVFDVYTTLATSDELEREYRAAREVRALERIAMRHGGRVNTHS